MYAIRSYYGRTGQNTVSPTATEQRWVYVWQFRNRNRSGLRRKPRTPRPAGRGKKAVPHCVITSYSIHYTKLYDYPPEYLPNLSEKLEQWKELAYPELCYEFMSEFATDIPPDILRECVTQSYLGFADPAIAPVRKLDDSRNNFV